MKILNNLIINNEFSEYLNENYDNSSEFLKYYLDINEIYYYVSNNTHLFIVENDLDLTYSNIKNFSKLYTESFLLSGIEKGASLITRMTTGNGTFRNILGTGAVMGANLAVPTAAGVVANSVAGEKVGSVVAQTTEIGMGVFDIAGSFMSASGGTTLAAGASTAVGSAGFGAILGTVVSAGFLGYGTGTLLNKFEPVSNVASWVMDHGLGKVISGVIEFPKYTMSVFGNAPVKVVENAKINNIPGVVSPATIATRYNNLDNTEFYESGFFEKFINYVSSKFNAMGSEISSVWSNLLNIAQNQPHYLYGPILVLGIIGIIIKYKLKRQKLKKHK